MAKTPGGNKKTLGSIRSKAGLPAKAGRRRPAHLASEHDRDGHRNWVPCPGKGKPNPGRDKLMAAARAQQIFDSKIALADSKGGR